MGTQAFALKVTCILPLIPHDPEDDVSMEDEHSDELESVKDISKKGYKFKADDWKNRSVDTLDTLDALIHMTIHMTENVETSQASAWIEDDSENTKLNKIIELMMENAKSMKDRMSLLEAENMELRARVSELEGNQNVARHTQTPVFPTNVTPQEDTHVVHNTPSSPVSSLISRVIEETQHLQTSASSPLSTLFENGADVEIATSDDATCRIWYPGNVFATNLCDGVEKVAVTLFADQKRVTVTGDKIRPKPPADDREKKFEMMDNVEAFYSIGWSSGQVIMIPGENTFSVYLNSSMETLEFKASDLRIHREWLDGVWKMADETPLHETASRQDEANPDQTQQDTKEPTNENILQNISDTQRLTRARAKILREQNKNEEPRVQTHFDVGANVEIASKDEDRYVKWYPGIVLKTDIRNGVEMLKVDIRPQPPPGDTKGFELMDKVEAYHNEGWCSGVVHIILSNDIYSVRFNSSTEFIQFNLSELRIPKEWVAGVWKMEKEHIDVAFPMLNQKRIEQSSWFSDYENLQKPDKKGINILKGWVGEVVRGLICPNNMWMQDVDIVYGVVHERLVDHFIGVEIHLMENTITIFQCGVHKRSVLVSLCENRVIIEMMLIPAIKLEMMNEEINFNDIVPFQVKKAEGLPKTKLPFNCGLFVVKMLECRSLGLKKMSCINDDTAMDLRSKLCCEMFDLFMDKDFQEGCRR
ncbi:hypothetical protein Bca52824_073224 [Brassica carinata]|uniref:Agenet domain-containing protein n=1 Tax=Brassica carinata TaxID=52824 RepID=A0A8X7U4M9_BRACI|nr:hypothetical protein Bca52824_073224 [Brassica carinata]